MKMSFRILNKSLENRLRMNRFRFAFGFGIIFIAILYIAPFELIGVQHTLIRAIIWLISIAGIVFIERKINNRIIKKNIIGKIKMNGENQLEYLKDNRNLKINIEQIQLLEFDFEGHYGQGSILQYLYPIYADYYFGTSNKINFQYEDKEYNSCIFIENRAEKEMFYNSIRIALEHSVTVTERTNGKQSYGGEFLSYKEIQEYKDKFGLN